MYTNNYIIMLSFQYQFQEPGASVSRSAADKEGWPFSKERAHTLAVARVQPPRSRVTVQSAEYKWEGTFPFQLTQHFLFLVIEAWLVRFGKYEWLVSITGQQSRDMGRHKTAPVYQRTQAQKVHTHGHKWSEYMPICNSAHVWEV